MKKHTEKQPIDDLFARKLGNMSLPPSPDGFERLQARMGQGKQEARVVFWRNPAMQRYMAAAACLLLVCLFGWLYWPADSKVIQGEQVATNQSSILLPTKKKTIERQVDQPSERSTLKTITPDLINQEVNKEQLAEVSKPAEVNRRNRVVALPTINRPQMTIVNTLPVTNEAVLAQATTVDPKTKPEVMTPDVIMPTAKPASEQVADNKLVTKPTQVAERVLVVTIAEPEALVAARQAAKVAVEEKPVVAANEKPVKESKVGGLWQQVKRIKQGELFARQDNGNNDDRGLLGRAYSGLKHSLDKDKSAKQ